jgi:hypothetical protein
MSNASLQHRFGSDSHEYFELPVGRKTLSITIQNPGKMTSEIGLSVANAIAEHRDAMTDFFDAGRYLDQEHVQPDLRIALPGDYLMRFSGGEMRSNTDMGKLETETVKTIGITLNFGQLHCKANMEDIGSAVDTVSEAVGALIDDLILRLPLVPSGRVLADMMQ